MKIGFVPHVPFSLVQGGAEVQAIKTKQAIEQFGYQVAWLDLSDPNFIKKIDLIHFFGLSPHLSWWAQLASQYKPVVISPIFYATQLKYKIFFNLLKYFRGTTPRKTFQMAQIADVLLPNSQAEAKQIAKFFKVSSQKIFVIPNGVEKNFVGTNPESFLKKYLPDFKKNQLFVLSVQNICERKNTISLIQAAVELKIPLVLIGSLKLASGSYISQIKFFSKRYPNLIRYIPFIPREELKNAYAAAHVHALPSYLETPGLSSLEAGLNGCNLVVGDCLPVREYFQGLAYIVKQNKSSIKRGLELALSSPRNYFGQSEVIRTKYNWESIGKKIISVYKKILM